MVLREQLHDQRAYLVDIGELHKNRFSLYLENELGSVEIIDRHGKATASNFDYEMDRPTYIRVEFSNVPNSSFISVFVNNREVVHLQNEQSLDVQLNFSSMIVGTDFEREGFARFELMEQYIHGKTLNVWERIDMYRYFLKKTAIFPG